MASNYTYQISTRTKVEKGRFKGKNLYKIKFGGNKFRGNEYKLHKLKASGTSEKR